MKICGIEISSNQAILVVLKISEGEVELHNTTVKKMTLSNEESQESINSFRDAILNFFRDNDIELVAIKQRAQTGRFGGSGITFKIETLIQLYEKEVRIINPRTIATKIKNINLSEFAINQYQTEALKTAIAAL